MRSTACPRRRTRKTPSIWNPLPGFDTVQRRPAARQHPVGRATSSARRGRHPARGVVGDPDPLGERAPADARQRGRAVRHLPDQPDHAGPRLGLDRDLPHVGRLGRLLRPPRAARRRRQRLRDPAPGLVISPYAKQGYIDHQTLELRRVPAVRRRPLPRRPAPRPRDRRPARQPPDVRENAPQLGDLRDAFDFTQAPRPPLVLPTVAGARPRVTARARARSDRPRSCRRAPLVGEAPFEVRFNPSRSRADAGISKWTLDFGDGASVTGSGPAAGADHAHLRGARQRSARCCRYARPTAASARRPCR